MIYEFACDDCKIVTDVERPIERSGDLAACPVCNQTMRRLFFAPRLFNRAKPGTFKHHPDKLDAWDDRLAHLKNLEQTSTPAQMRQFKSEVGDALWNETLAHNKQVYG